MIPKTLEFASEPRKHREPSLGSIVAWYIDRWLNNRASDCIAPARPIFAIGARCAVGSHNDRIAAVPVAPQASHLCWHRFLKYLPFARLAKPRQQSIRQCRRPTATLAGRRNEELRRRRAVSHMDLPRGGLSHTLAAARCVYGRKRREFDGVAHRRSRRTAPEKLSRAFASAVGPLGNDATGLAKRPSTSPKLVGAILSSSGSVTGDRTASVRLRSHA